MELGPFLGGVGGSRLGAHTSRPPPLSLWLQLCTCEGRMSRTLRPERARDRSAGKGPMAQAPAKTTPIPCIWDGVPSFVDGTAPSLPLLSVSGSVLLPPPEGPNGTLAASMAPAGAVQPCPPPPPPRFVCKGRPLTDQCHRPRSLIGPGLRRQGRGGVAAPGAWAAPSHPPPPPGWVWLLEVRNMIPPGQSNQKGAF